MKEKNHGFSIGKESQSLHEMVKQGNTHLRADQFETAQKFFQTAIQTYPNRPQGYAGLARISQRLNDWNAAVQFWDQALYRVKDEKTRLNWFGGKAKALIKANRLAEAETFFLKAQTALPNLPLGFEGMVQIAEAQGNIKRAIENIKTVLEKFPEYQPAHIEYGRLLSLNGEFDMAETLLKSVLANDPNNLKALKNLAANARLAKEYHLAKERWRDLVERDPGNVQYETQYILCLLDLVEYEKAQDFFDNHLDEQSSCQYKSLQAVILAAKFELKAALKVLDELNSTYPNHQAITPKQIRYLLTLTKATGDLKYTSKALAIIEKRIKAEPHNQNLQEEKIEILVTLSRKEEAMQQIRKLPIKSTKKAMQLYVWMAYMNGEIEQAKTIWNELTKCHFVPQLQKSPIGTLKKIGTKDIQLEKNTIILFTAVRNERWRLPWFLEYYRSIGVEYFFFVDNHSTDGTREYLQKQEDVHLFWTRQMYAQAHAGIQWINTLVDEYGQDCWCIYVDVDEALIFPDIEKRSLKSLTQYMTDHGYEALVAFMLDTFSPGIKPVQRSHEYKDFFKDYPLFDNQYTRLETIDCPFQYTTGGIRKTFGLFENQTKTPLIRGGRGIQFIISSHTITPAILSDVSAVVLHFKLAGDFEDYFNHELETETRSAACKRRHWGYLQALDEFTEDESFIGTHTKTYRSSRQLIELGLINTSEKFEAKKYD